MVLGELAVVPDPHVAVHVETNQGVIDGKGTQLREELVKADEGLAEDVESLFVGKVAGVHEPIGDVLREDGDIFVIGAEI